MMQFVNHLITNYPRFHLQANKLDELTLKANQLYTKLKSDLTALVVVQSGCLAQSRVVYGGTSLIVSFVRETLIADMCTPTIDIDKQ